jgi:AcrR family transcriptional regulator
MGRAKDPKSADIEKFMKLKDDKRNRILNAAMKEFRYGFKKASTDIIVKEAGISKGLLFHYFGTKEQLYVFLARYGADLMQGDYFEMINQGHQDILEVFWQMALLKKDIANQHPYLYDFLNGVYIHRADAPGVEITTLLEEEERILYDEILSKCDMGLLRDDIDHRKAIDIIFIVMENIMTVEESRVFSAGGRDDENYEKFLEVLRGYSDIFKKTLYK